MFIRREEEATDKLINNTLNKIWTNILSMKKMKKQPRELLELNNREHKYHKRDFQS